MGVIVQLSTAHGMRPTCVGMVICEVLAEDHGSSYSGGETMYASAQQHEGGSTTE